MAETTPPPMAPADIWTSSRAKGRTTAQPASAAVPCRAANQVSKSWPKDCTAASSVVGAASANMRRISSAPEGRTGAAVGAAATARVAMPSGLARRMTALASSAA
jgi:hypothetical protein